MTFRRLATLILFLSVSVPVPGDISTPAAVSATQPTAIRDDPRVQSWGRAMVWGGVLVLVFIVGTWAIIVFTRRYLQFLNRESSEPTPVVDVWSMHRLPPETDLESTDDDKPGESHPPADPDNP
ncbi:MAG: hypothetical protein ACE5EQ_09095 [Phycisphaerae bacterium]